MIRSKYEVATKWECVLSRVSAIIVSHNSGPDLARCIAALRGQTSPVMEIIVVDAGSAESGQIHSLCARENIRCICTENIGFARANNLGYRATSPSADFILFINPDAFASVRAVEQSIACMSGQDAADIGCVTGRLLGFDRKSGKPTGLLDSTGIFRKWYGRWYDRGQGKPDIGQYAAQEDVPAACGAFMFCRRVALEQAGLPGGAVFDPDFFLYKEDIEVCLRMRKSGWRIVYCPKIELYHCRGWRTRRTVPYRLRLVAAGSELLLYKKHPSPYLFWAIFKYFLVRCLRI